MRAFVAFLILAAAIPASAQTRLNTRDGARVNRPEQPETSSAVGAAAAESEQMTACGLDSAANAATPRNAIDLPLGPWRPQTLTAPAQQAEACRRKADARGLLEAAGTTP